MRDAEPERRRLTLNQWLRDARKAWHGVKLDQPDWGQRSHSLALSAELRPEALDFYLILNAYWDALEFELPVGGEGVVWRRWIDTALEPPNEIVEWRLSPPFLGQTYHAGARSVVVLFRGKGLGSSCTSANPLKVGR
jgi:glycogen operon protein